MDYGRLRVLFSPDAGDGGGSGDAGGGSDGGSGTGGSGSGGGGSGDDWRSNIPEELRNDPSIKDFKDVGSLAKSYVHTKKLVGNNIAVPKKDAKPEEWDAFYAKVGRPEKPDKYELNKIEGAEQLGISDDKNKAFLSEAHRLGLTQRQAAGLHEWFSKSSIEDLTKFNSERENSFKQGLDGLKSEWGDAYDQNIEQAKNAIKEFGDESITQILNETRLGDHPALIKMFQKIGRAMADDKMYGRGQEVGSGLKMTPSEAQNEIGKLHFDSEFQKAYHDAEHPGHQVAVERMAKLHEAAFKM